MADGSGILDPNALSFAAFPNTPMSLEALKRRRAVQLAIASKGRPFPKNVGEGLTSLGEALGERRLDDQLNAAEKGYTGARDADPAMTTLPKVSALDPAVNPATNELRNRLTAYYAGGPGGATPNPTLAARDTSPQATSASGDPSGDPDAVAIGGIETGGIADPYRAVGVPTRYGRALGKYGVVEANVPKWTAAALGQALTPQQYLNDKDAQDAVFKHRFGQYKAQFGEEGAARAWFGGPGNVNNPGVTDAHGRLTVGTYGQDYLRRLQGARRSGAVYPSGSMTGPSLTTDAAPVLAEENPATPTDIAAAPAPMLVASGASDSGDAGGSATIDSATGAPPPTGGSPGMSVPGVLDPRSPEPAAPPSGLRPADPVATKPIVKPPLPKREEAPTPEELQGLYLRRRYPGDEVAQARADYLIKFGADRRASINAARMKEYEQDLASYEKAAESERIYEREREAKAFELSQKKKAAAKADLESQQYAFGKDKALALSKESYEEVKAIPAAAQAIKGIRQVMNSDAGMFTGKDAKISAELAGWAQTLGLPYNPKLNNTQVFQGLIPPILAGLRPAVVGPGTQSQPEFKLLQDAAAGNITLERSSIERIMNAIEKLNHAAAVTHHRRLYANASDDNGRQVVFGNYGLPMDQIIPARKVERLRAEIAKHGDDQAAVAAEMEAFNKDNYTPGLAQQLLGR
jgi:hypothetical protein